MLQVPGVQGEVTVLDKLDEQDRTGTSCAQDGLCSLQDWVVSPYKAYW